LYQSNKKLKKQQYFASNPNLRKASMLNDLPVNQKTAAGLLRMARSIEEFRLGPQCPDPCLEPRLPAAPPAGDLDQPFTLPAQLLQGPVAHPPMMQDRAADWFVPSADA
jgi:hypothetical protein